MELSDRGMEYATIADHESIADMLGGQPGPAARKLKMAQAVAAGLHQEILEYEPERLSLTEYNPGKWRFGVNMRIDNNFVIFCDYKLPTMSDEDCIFNVMMIADDIALLEHEGCGNRAFKRRLKPLETRLSDPEFFKSNVQELVKWLTATLADYP